MELSKLDIILMQLDTTASFSPFESKTTLNGRECKELNNYIKDLEKLKKDIKEYLIQAATFADTNTEKTMIIDLLKLIKESENK